MKPFVTAIMPTMGRPEFAARALEMFLAQDYKHAEIVVMDDALRPSFAVPPAGARYYRQMSRTTLGEKRNLAIARAEGEVIVHWDDDDEYHPGRISDQVARLYSGDIDVTGYHTMRFRNGQGEEWRWTFQDQSKALGVSLCYRREWVRANRFLPKQSGEDGAFVDAVRKNGTILNSDGLDFIIASIHSGNTSPRDLSCGNFERI